MQMTSLLPLVAEGDEPLGLANGHVRRVCNHHSQLFVFLGHAVEGVHQDRPLLLLPLPRHHSLEPSQDQRSLQFRDRLLVGDHLAEEDENFVLGLIRQVAEDKGDRAAPLEHLQACQLESPAPVDLEREALVQGGVLLPFPLGEVVDLGPVVVPRLQSLPRELPGQLRVERAAEGSEAEPVGALDDGLALAVEREGAVVALEGPELLGGSDEGDALAVADEDRGLAGRDEDGAVLAVVDVQVRSDVEHEERAVPAPVDVVLLLLYRVDPLHLERTALPQVPVVVGVVLLLHRLRLQDVRRKGGLRLSRFRLCEGLLLEGGGGGGDGQRERVLLDEGERLLLLALGLELVAGAGLEVRLRLAEAEGLGQLLAFVEVRVVGGAQVLSEDVVIVLVGFLLRRVLPDVLDVLVHLEGLLVHVVRELLLLAPLRAWTHVPHYNFQILTRPSDQNGARRGYGGRGKGLLVKSQQGLSHEERSGSLLSFSQLSLTTHLTTRRVLPAYVTNFLREIPLVSSPLAASTVLSLQICYPNKFQPFPSATFLRAKTRAFQWFEESNQKTGPAMTKPRGMGSARLFIDGASDAKY